GRTAATWAKGGTPESPAPRMREGRPARQSAARGRRRDCVRTRNQIDADGAPAPGTFGPSVRPSVCLTPWLSRRPNPSLAGRERSSSVCARVAVAGSVRSGTAAARSIGRGDAGRVGPGRVRTADRFGFRGSYGRDGPAEHRAARAADSRGRGQG